MNRSQTLRLFSFAALLAVGSAPGCASDEGSSQELDDTEWIGANSFEVNARIKGSFTHAASGTYADLASDTELQTALVTTHISYAKNALEHGHYYLNMLPDEILSMDVQVDGDDVTVAYEASIDMVRPSVHGVDEPTLADLGQTHFVARMPADPVGVYARGKKACASDYGSYTLTEEKYFYYFDPEQSGCELVTNEASIDIVDIYPNPEVYPEYDRLLNPLDQGTGFVAAILPNRGDDDPMSRYDAHKRELDTMTGLTPESHDGFVRYAWQKDGATIVIDLFDPTVGWFTSDFHTALSDYQLVFYNGHSNYGNQPFLDRPEAYSDAYQIIGMHSCKSYSYYAGQVATGKATAEDPTGWANADMIATGRSSYPSDSPYVLVALLDGLMSGLGAVLAGEPERAPSWQAIGERMRSVAPSILYGVAGARNNAWNPGTDPEASTCGHSMCASGAALDPSCDPCVAKIASHDAYCTDSFWDDICVGHVAEVCEATCGQ